MNSTVPVALSDGVYWIGAHREHAYLQCNTYAVIRDGAVLVVDPGPDILFPEIYAGLATIANPGSVTGIVVTQSAFDAVSSLPQWNSSGVTATMYAHWWAALAIRLGGYSGKTVHLHSSNVDRVHPVEGIEFKFLPNLSDHGMLCVFDRPSATLFTGDLFGYPEGGSGSLFERVNGYNRRLLHNPDTRRAVRTCIEELGVRVICPQHGDVIDLEGIELDRLFAGYTDSDDTGTDAGSVEPAETLETELDTLRKQNVELMESVVLANDARIKDSATGFYNETFLQEVLPTLIGPDRPAATVLIAVDEPTSGSWSTSPALQVQTMRALATEIINASIPGALVFRFRGYSCSVVLPGRTIPEIRDSVQELVNRVRESDLFPQATTVSIALGDTDQLQQIRAERQDPLRGIIGGMIALLDQLERDGEETYLELGSTVAPEEIGRFGGALVVTSDPILAESLAALLDARGIPSRRVDNGGAAAAAALRPERSEPPPELIITELNAPQLDGFQLRQTLLDDPNTRDIPLFLILDYKTVDIVERTLALGIEHTFPKPLDLNEIAGICELVLQRGRS